MKISSTNFQASNNITMKQVGNTEKNDKHTTVMQNFNKILISI